MTDRIDWRLIVICLAVLCLGVVCALPHRQPALQIVTATPESTATFASTTTPTATSTATSTPIPTLTSTQTASPTTALLVDAQTPLPDNLVAISLESAGQVSGLAAWHVNTVTDLAWLPDERILAVATSDSILLYDVLTRQVLRSLYPERKDLVDIAVSPSGNWLVAGTRQGTEQKGYISSLEVWHGPNWKPYGVLYDVDQGLSNMSFSPGGENLAVAYASPVYGCNSVQIWNVGAWQIANVMYPGTALDAAFSLDGNFLAITPDRYAMNVWDFKENKWMYKLYTSFTGAVNTIAFSPDGYTLASGHYDGVIRLWDIRTGDVLLTINSDEVIESLAFSPDGRVLASGGSYENSLVRLWDVGNGALLRSLDGHTSGVDHLLFSADGQWLVSGSYDGSVWLWGVRP
ncbi:MAG: WD40 repeat domain-containing protein [Chloroflexota bacterium]